MKRSIVVGYDQSPSGDRALAQAGREAAWRDASVTVVNAFHWIAVGRPGAYVPMGVETSLKDAADSIAATGVETLRRHYPGMTVDSAVIAGPTADAIAEAAREADLLVLGNRGRGGFTGLLLGSVSIRTLTLASGPTMIVRGTPREPTDTVVLALDVEDPGEELMDFAFTEAALRGARLEVVNVWDLDWTEAAGSDVLARAKEHAVADIRSALERRLNPWHAKHPDVHLVIEVMDGMPSAVLTELTASADLIIAGAHRRGDGHPGMRPGPITHTLLHHADCPVTVVPRA
ncbi:universal stress protein [Catenulispora sp. NL8]|uniref:Universal stress protein n=1 Tax=Catenulispora pinistramenti TaxID=2705254 RepID=A0ABS5KM91_9ACTN|nr:universal stress protein [Catenulispora pinistramenti]MBS2547139.1 universal stress protein [Catenulispora pinistramenti]